MQNDFVGGQFVHCYRYPARPSATLVPTTAPAASGEISTVSFGAGVRSAMIGVPPLRFVLPENDPRSFFAAHFPN